MVSTNLVQLLTIFTTLSALTFAAPSKETAIFNAPAISSTATGTVTVPLNLSVSSQDAQVEADTTTEQSPDLDSESNSKTKEGQARALALAPSHRGDSQTQESLQKNVIETTQDEGEMQNEEDDKDVDLDLDTWEAPSYIQKYFPYYLTGFDDEDRPIWFAEVGKFNLRKIVAGGDGSFEDLEKYAHQATQRILKSIKDSNRTSEWEVREGVFVIDFDGLDMYQFANTRALGFILKTAKEFLTLSMKHMGGNININVNYAAELLMNMLRPLLGRAMEKVELYGTNKAKWIPALRRKLPLHAIPSWYGGSPNFHPIKVYG